MGDLAPLVTAGGGLTVLALVIGYLLSSNRADRREYQEAIDRAERRADEAAARQRAAEERAEGLQIALDEVRAARRRAEDWSAVLAREVERYKIDPPDGPP